MYSKLAEMSTGMAEIMDLRGLNIGQLNEFFPCLPENPQG
jgi:hypothetical protein